MKNVVLAKFFWLLLLDDKSSLKASRLALKIKSPSKTDEQVAREVMRLLNIKRKSTLEAEKTYNPKLPPTWLQFYTQAEFEEILVLLALEICKFDLHQFCKAFHISEGTAKTRLSRALENLGSLA